jgi:hypothetical protein
MCQGRVRSPDPDSEDARGRRRPRNSRPRNGDGLRPGPQPSLGRSSRPPSAPRPDPSGGSAATGPSGRRLAQSPASCGCCQRDGHRFESPPGSPRKSTLFPTPQDSRTFPPHDGFGLVNPRWPRPRSQEEKYVCPDLLISDPLDQGGQLSRVQLSHDVIKLGDDIENVRTKRVKSFKELKAARLQPLKDETWATYDVRASAAAYTGYENSDGLGSGRVRKARQSNRRRD